MRRIICLALAAAACGGAGEPAATLQFSATPLTSVSDAGNQFQIAIRSSPQPPGLGLQNFQFTVTDTKNEPLDGLQVSVVPWMPAMGHGAPVAPVVQAMGGGVYLLTNVDFFMPGVWQLRTSVTGSVTGSVTPQFQIQ